MKAAAVNRSAEISKTLNPMRRRIVAQHYLRYLLRGMLAGALLSSLFLVISFITPWLGVAEICWQASAGSIGLAMLLAWGRQPDLWTTACLVDSKGLKERVTTALELDNQESVMAARQRQDALLQLQAFDWRSNFPWTLPKYETRFLAAALLVTAMLFFLPNPQEEETDHQLAVIKEIQMQEKKVAEIKKDLQKNEKPIINNQRQEAVKVLEKLQENLQQSDDLKKALKSLAQAEEQLARLSEAELKQKENNAQKSGITPLQTQPALLSDKNDSEIKNSDSSNPDSSNNPDSSKPAGQNNNKDNNMLLADLNQAAQTIADARRALLGVANHQKGQLAVANGNAAAISGMTQGSNGGDNPTAASGQAGTAANTSSGSSGGTLESSSSMAGQQGQGNTGTGNSGSGNQSGSGNGNQTGSGSGSGGRAGQGSGSTDNSSGQSSNSDSAPGTGFPEMKYREYEKIYDPERIGISGESSVVRGTAGEGPQQSVETADPALMSGLLRPYHEVIASYSQAARDSLGRSSIPAGMNEVVKNYFSSLEE